MCCGFLTLYCQTEFQITATPDVHKKFVVVCKIAVLLFFLLKHYCKGA